MQSKKENIKAPKFDEKKTEPRQRNFDKIQHRFNVPTSELKFKVEREEAVIIKSTDPEILAREIEQAEQRKAERAKRVEHFQQKTKQNSKNLLTQTKAEVKANEEKSKQEKLKKKEFESQVKNPITSKKFARADFDQERNIENNYEKENNLSFNNLPVQKDPEIEKMIQLSSVQNSVTTAQLNQTVRQRMLAKSSISK